MNETEIQPKPFMIYRDGKLDRAYQLRQQAKVIVHGAGQVALEGLKVSGRVLDHLASLSVAPYIKRGDTLGPEG